MLLQTHSLRQKSAKQNRAATLPNIVVSGQDCTPISIPAAQAGTTAGLILVLTALPLFCHRCSVKVVDTTGEQVREAQVALVAPSPLCILNTVVSGGSSVNLFGSSSRTVAFGNINIL